MAKKSRVVVLMGGPSSEREVSLVTGQAIFANLDRKKYQPVLVEMTKDSRFLFAGKGKNVFDWAKEIKKIDLVFIAMHGAPGEDGGVQGMLEVFGVPYTGSGILASALAMSKPKTAELYRLHDIPTPSFVNFSYSEWQAKESDMLKTIEQLIRYPAVVKPADQGSAVGVSIVQDRAGLKKAIKKTATLFQHLIVQEFIKGQEATCGVLEKNGQPFALPPTHILANFNEFYDYTSKYSAGGSTHICPADFSAETNKKIQALALEAHRVLGCRGMSRSDVMVTDSGDLYVLETNTIPGMTPTSLLPEAAGKAGISFSKMLDLIISASL